MAVESWITPEETPALAEAATLLIEERLSRLSPTERATFWHSIRKCYNTPYNAPAPRAVRLPTAKAAEPVMVVPQVALPDLAAIQDLASMQELASMQDLAASGVQAA